MITKLDFEKVDRFIYGAMNDAGGTSGQETQTIQDLIDETRTVLSEETPNISEWEDLELRQAHILLDAGFPQLAFISVGKAIAINCLLPEEYAFGFAVVKRQTRAVSEVGLASASAKVIRQDTAQNLNASEKLVATRLEEVQEQTAKKLLERQVAAASALEQKNLEEAYELSLTQEKALETLHEGEKKIVSHMHDLEHTLSWMAGGYAHQVIPSGTIFDEIYRDIQNTQKETARILKQHHENIASDLKKHQVYIAESLKASEKSDAVNLKTVQEEKAVHLKEEQEIEALKKALADKDAAS
jgi:AraC-like DNA-binding protein